MTKVAGAVLVLAAAVLVLATRPGPEDPAAAAFTTFTVVAAWSSACSGWPWS